LSSFVELQSENFAPYHKSMPLFCDYMCYTHDWSSQFETIIITKDMLSGSVGKVIKPISLWTCFTMDIPGPSSNLYRHET